MSETRKIAAILVADVIGYGRVVWVVRPQLGRRTDPLTVSHASR
jgi:hypothetical protein